MSEFDIIECGFNAADETINFGARMLAEGDHLFEASTLASIKQSDGRHTLNSISVNACSKGNKLYYAINKSVAIFNDLSCTEVDFNTSFEEYVDSFCVSHDSQYLLICQRNGSVSYININTQEIIFSEELCNNDWLENKFFIGCFLEEFSNSSISFIIVTKRGSIYRVKLENTDGDDLPCIKNLVQDLKFKVNTAAMIVPHLLVDGENMALYNLNTGELIEDATANLTKVFPYSRWMFIGLNTDGELVRICARTLLLFYINSQMIFKNFLYTSITLKDSHTKPYCLCITKDNDIQLYDTHPILSDLKFSLKADNNVSLIFPENTDDEPMYISLIEKQDVIQELRVQVVSETAPEVRLKRLLRRQRFDEAEQFAKLYGLSNAEILKAKAQVIIDKRSCSQEDISQLLEILDGIEDTLFKLQSCIDTYQCCDRLQDVRRILSYGCGCVVKHNMGAEVLDLHEMLLDIMFRFDTFMLIDKLGVANIDWPEFRDGNLITLLCEYLEKYNIDTAIILYNRFDKHTNLILDECGIETILNLLDNLSLNIYRPFLYCFIPLSLSYLPASLPLFVKWLKRKVYSFELNNPNEFPQNAIDFVDNTLRLMKVDCVNYQQQHMTNREATDDLAKLVKALKTLRLLRDSYQIMIPLKEYLKDAEHLIHTLLSLDLEDDVFNKLVQDFLCKFLFENSLDPDDIFLEAITNILQYEENYWIKIVPSILQNIRSVEVKLTAIIDLIKVAAVPWSEKLRGIIKESLEYRHQLTEIIKQQVEHEPLYRILKRSSYNLQYVTINDDFDLEHIISRIMYCNEPTMIEDIYQLCKTTDQKHTADFMLVNHFVSKREYIQALRILDDNTEEAKTWCCDSIIRCIETNDMMKRYNQNEPYLDILRCLQERCTEYGKKKIENIIACLQIRSSLYANVEIKDLQSRSHREQLLETLLLNVDQDILDKTLTHIRAVDTCKQIASLLNLPKEEVLLKFCDLSTYNSKIIKECAGYIYDYETNPKNLCLTATLILKNVFSSINTEDMLNSIMNLNETMPEPVISLGDEMECLRLAQNLAAKAILLAVPRELDACCEVFNWAISTFYMTKENPSIIINDVYLPEVSMPSMKSMYSLKHFTNSYILYSTSDINSDVRYLTHYEVPAAKLTQEEFMNKIQQLPMMLQNFCLEGQTLTALKLILTLKSSLKNCRNIDQNVMKTINSITKQFICSRLLPKVFSANNIDTDFAFGLLISIDLNESKSFVDKQLMIHKKQINKFKRLAQLGLRVLNYHNININRDFYTSVIKLSDWWIRLKNCQIPMKTFFLLPREQLLETLIHNQLVDLVMMESFCQDFQLNVSTYYQIYLKKTLLNWKPDYDKVEDIYGKVRIKVKNDENELLKRCNDVVNLLGNKETVYNFINGFRYEVNFYHYEVFFVMFTILGRLNLSKDYKKKLLLLRFLKNYRRVNKPSSSEIEEWYSLFPDSQAIDPLSQWRMPFTPTLFSFDIWKIIRPELNLQTYNTWFNAISILDKILNKNEICSYIIKEIVSSGLLQNTTFGDWLLHPVLDHLFEQVDLCVQNMSNLEMATSAVYQLVMHAPKGADQVNAAKLCLKYAIRYKESGPADDPELLKAFTKVQKKYQGFAANHILHLCQVDVNKYSDLLLDPNELIDALYTDRSIIERADRVLLSCADINKAVDDLGHLFNINVHKTRLELLESWLSERVSLNLNTTTTNVSAADETDTNSVNLKRAAYICQSEDKTIWQEHLLKTGLAEDGDKSVYYMANALNCFMIVSDVNTVEELTSMSFDEFRNYVDKLYLLSELEYLGLAMDVETLDNYKKPDLLRRLAQDIYNPTAVKTMATLCITYSEYDLKYWKIIIVAAIKLNLISSLKKYVHFLKNEPAFKYKQFYINAWQNVIDHSFNITPTNIEQTYNCCVENMLMIQSCPVLPSLHFGNIFNKCCNLQMFEFAAIIMQYLPAEEQKEYVQRIKNSKCNLSVAVGKLSNFGIWGTAQVQRLLVSY